MLRARILARPATLVVRAARRGVVTQPAQVTPLQPQATSKPATEASVTTTFDAATDIAPAALDHAPVVTADAVSGAPQQLRHRVVRIYKPTPNTMQSGASRNSGWRIDWDTALGGGRWENPLMGWASSADYMQGTRMNFATKEDAMHFADKQGWDFYVQGECAVRIPPKNYAENYVYRPGRLRIARTK
ncbi:Ndufs4, NADH dehydrogenase Fe-S protein 4 [Auriculariales sp. MPI-PUGE-AT-0066]|nr:Ndufs4, NADH dehydrogenase Fe-S protein 4 [Auriculariales sp. MPI-PUGE-AT-0066]